MRLLILLLLTALLFPACFDLQTGEPINGIALGTWRGAFILEDQVVPVMYEISSSDKGKTFEVVFKTAQQKLKADAVRLWGDSLFIDFHKTNSQLRLVCQIDQMDGFLYDNTEQEYPIVFTGQNAIMHRFPDIRKTPTADLTGDWQLEANSNQDSTQNARIRLVAQENYIEGKLLMKDRADIVLEGTVQGDKLYLSGFDGKTACLLSATIEHSKKLTQGNLKLNNKSFFWEAEAAAGVSN